MAALRYVGVVHRLPYNEVMRKSKEGSDDKKKASNDRNRVAEVLLAERLGLSDDWQDPDNIPDLPQTLPPVGGRKVPAGEAKEVENLLSLLVARGCRRPVLYWCLERLGPGADKVRKGQVKYLVPGDVETKNPWVTATSASQTCEDMARFLALSKAYAKALQRAQNELLMVAEAQPDAHPLPRGFLTEEPDNTHEAMLTLRESVAWVRKLGEAYHAPNAGLLVKSKGSLFLLTYVWIHTKYLPDGVILSGKGFRQTEPYRITHQVADPIAIIGQVYGGIDSSPDDLIDKLEDFHKGFPKLYDRMVDMLKGLDAPFRLDWAEQEWRISIPSMSPPSQSGMSWCLEVSDAGIRSAINRTAALVRRGRISTTYRAHKHCGSIIRRIIDGGVDINAGGQVQGLAGVPLPSLGAGPLGLDTNGLPRIMPEQDSVISASGVFGNSTDYPSGRQIVAFVLQNAGMITRLNIIATSLGEGSCATPPTFNVFAGSTANTGTAIPGVRYRANYRGHDHDAAAIPALRGKRGRDRGPGEHPGHYLPRTHLQRHYELHGAMMKKCFQLLLFVAALCGAGVAHAATCSRLSANPSQATLQSAITSCGNSGGGTVQLSAGTTTLTSTLTMACGVLVTGPQTTLQSNGLYTAPTAILTGTPPMDAFTSSGGCTASTNWGLENLNFNYTAPWTLDASNYSNIVFKYNTVTNLQHDSNGGYTSSLWFGGNVTNALQNITIEYNTFGDANSCVPPAFNTLYTDASCAGVHVYLPGTVINMTVMYNTFFHLDEGIQFNTNAGKTGGNTVSVSQNLIVEYNYFNAIARNALENQISVQYAPTYMAYNVFNAVGGNSNMATSGACCNSGANSAVPSDQNPSVYQLSNLAYQPAAVVCSSGHCSGGFAQLGNEGYGNGPVLNHNMVQGNFCIGATYSTGVSSNAGTISYNVWQMPWPSAGYPDDACAGGTHYVGNEGGSLTPAIVGNVEGRTPSAITSVAPTISPASGARTFPLTVTLTDLGQTSATYAGPLGNTGIWYTTDGSTPVPGASCTAPCGYLPTGGTFTLASAATVKAVGMWGTPPQPTSYPAGYGFVPSAVVSAAYTGGTPTTAATPVLSPTGESFSGSVSVAISDSTQPGYRNCDRHAGY
jgi:hypothetical protein